MGYVNLDIIDFFPAEGTHYGEMMIILKKTWPRLTNNLVNLPSFYECDFQKGTHQLDKGKAGKGQTDKGMMDINQMDPYQMNLVKSKNILSSIKKSKFAQKYLKPLYKKYRGTGY
jgi:hypothetical protein